jgi:CSLREA domain-containing protein
MRWILVLLCAGVFVSFAALPAEAAEFQVNTTADTQDVSPGNGACADASGLCSLRAAITEANALAGADTITLPAGTYTQTLTAIDENANAGGDLDITSSITINGAGASTTIIQANAIPNAAIERVIHITSASAISVTISGVTVQNGVAPVAQDGGRGGGIKVGNNASTDENITFTLTNSTVQNNSAGTRGGGLAINKAKATIAGCTFTGNAAGGSDPGATSSAGGAMYIDSQDNVSLPSMSVSITDSVMANNRAESSVTNTFGGALIMRAMDATVTVDRCTVTGNVSDASPSPGFSGFAGGLYNQQAHMIVRNTVVSGNTSSHFHGGIRNLASTGAAALLEISNSTISNNTAVSDTAQGGVVSNIVGSSLDATTIVDHSTISGNVLSGAGESLGGGLLNTGNTGGAASLTLSNSTVSGNGARYAGGIYTDGTSATLTVDYSTVAANTAFAGGEGGGILQDSTPGGLSYISNSIIADNQAPLLPDIDGNFFTLDYNLIENVDGSGYTPAPHDQIGVDPRLGPLASNGGPTHTHYPQADSPIIDTIPQGVAGCGGQVGTDQRGFARPNGSGCEKGAVEFGSLVTPTPTVTPSTTPTPTASPTPAEPFTITAGIQDFGVVPVTMSSASVRFVVSNNTLLTTSGMTYSFAGQDGSSFSLSLGTCRSFLSPHSTCTLDVRFTPHSIGRKNATLIVTSTSVTGSGTALLTGTAVPLSAFDYDLDGISDISIFRPTTGEWYLQRSTRGPFGISFGVRGDRAVPADYDGDGRADIAVYRPSEGLWAILNSSTLSYTYYLFGYEDDLPVPADYTGDGRADICIFRPSTGVWYWRDSASGLYRATQFGASGDRPTIGDFDGDGRSDIAVFHPSSGVWYHLLSSNGQPYGERFGIASDVLVPADYDGDGRTELAVYRPSTGIWYLRMSSTGMWSYRVFGLSDDIPAPGDYDADGKADDCMFRPSEGNWYWQNSSDGSYHAVHFGTDGDRPTQSAFIY